MTIGSCSIVLGAATTGKRLMAVATVLTFLHVLAMFGWYRDFLPIDDWLYISFFDLDEEESIGTWFSALILFFAALLSLLQARLVKHENRGRVRGWRLLGVGFGVLSLDEIAGFHEFVNTVVEGTHWTSFGLLLVMAVGLALTPFLFALPRRTRWLFLLAGLIYVGGAVGIERATIWHEINDQMDTLGYNLTTALEEFMEMAGVILYIYAVLAHTAVQSGDTSLVLRLR